MSGMRPESVSRYSVRQSRSEIRRERRSRYVLWGLVAAACVVIAVFAALLLAGAGS